MDPAITLAFALFAHCVGDYILQNQWMADNKMKRADALAVHSAVHGVLFIILGAFIAPFGMALGLGVLYGMVHACIDHRRWVSGAKWPPKPIIVDQTLHLGQIAFWLLAITGGA